MGIGPGWTSGFLGPYGSWTGAPCKAVPPIQLERTEAAARREITAIFAPFRAHPKDREQEEHPWKLRAATLSMVCTHLLRLDL